MDRGSRVAVMTVEQLPEDQRQEMRVHVWKTAPDLLAAIVATGKYENSKAVEEAIELAEMLFLALYRRYIDSLP